MLPFLIGNNADAYSIEMGRCLLAEMVPTLKPSSVKRFKRSIRILNVFLSTGEIPKHSTRVEPPPLPGEIGAMASEFLDHKALQRVNKLTTEQYRRLLSYFVIGLQIKGVSSIDAITEDHVVEYLSVKESIDSRYTVMRQFYQYIQQHHPEIKDYSYLFEFMHSVRPEKLPSVYWRDEVCKIEAGVDRSTPVGKRTYAMLLLDTRLGLRISDIIGLRFSDIDWDKSLIRLVQAKTGRPIELPLLKDVGEAMVSYLKVRPKCDCDEIFVTLTPPITKMNRSGAGSLISKAITGCGVDCSNRKHGPHSMRFSLANNLLGQHVPLPTITAALGHGGSDVTMRYLRIDIEQLRLCALDVPPVNDEFYEQNNGIFFL